MAEQMEQINVEEIMQDIRTQIAERGFATKPAIRSVSISCSERTSPTGFAETCSG